MLFIYVLFYVDLTFAASFDNIVSCWRRLLTTITFSCVFLSSFSVIESFIILFVCFFERLIIYTCVCVSVSSYQDRGFIVNVLFPEIIPLVIISILYQFERPYVSFHHYGDACVFFVANRSKILYRVARTQNDCSKRNSTIRTRATFRFVDHTLFLPWRSPIHYSGIAQFIPIRAVLPVWLRNLGLSFNFRFEISLRRQRRRCNNRILFFKSFFEAQKSVSFVRFGSVFSTVGVCVWVCFNNPFLCIRVFVVRNRSRRPFYFRTADDHDFLAYCFTVLLRCLVHRLAFIVFENIQSQLFAFFKLFLTIFFLGFVFVCVFFSF